MRATSGKGRKSALVPLDNVRCNVVMEIAAHFMGESAYGTAD
jgi:hypothetical protein